MKLSHCRSCAAPIIWTVTANGKRMPVDADPLIASRGFRLEEVGVEAGGPMQEDIVATFTASPTAGERLYSSHFSTCPNAAQHRRSA